MSPANSAAQVDNWKQLNGALDTFLAQPAASTPAVELVRARSTLEAELEADGRIYGDFPPELAAELRQRLGQRVEVNG